MIPLRREVEPRGDRLLVRAFLAVVTLLATVAFWSMLGLALAAGCWRGGAPPTCPYGAVSSGGPGGGPVCEKPRIVQRRYPNCKKLTTLVNRLKPMSLATCDAVFYDDYQWSQCVRQQYEFRIATLEWRWDVAVSYCADEIPLNEEPPQ